jgi:hypothetical protein
MVAGPAFALAVYENRGHSHTLKAAEIGEASVVIRDQVCGVILDSGWKA